MSVIAAGAQAQIKIKIYSAEQSIEDAVQRLCMLIYCCLMFSGMILAEKAAHDTIDALMHTVGGSTRLHRSKY